MLSQSVTKENAEGCSYGVCRGLQLKKKVVQMSVTVWWGSKFLPLYSSIPFAKHELKSVDV